MNNAELDRLLQTAPVPERTADFWEQLPKAILTRTHRQTKLGTAQGPERCPWWASWTWGFSAAAACLVIAFTLGNWRSRPAHESNPRIAQARIYFQEIESLFPNQVQSIVFDDRGPRLRLAEKADVPDSTPLYVRICGPRGCQQHVTFSGQQIRVNGEDCDVLTDAAGHVLIVGKELVWSSASLSRNVGKYRIEARPLGASL